MFLKDNYDNSLWLILSMDKKNREKIINFIKSLPEEFYFRLKKSLKQYNGSCDIDGCFKEKDGYLYTYNISSFDGKLCISKGLYDGTDCEEVLMLYLNPYETEALIDCHDVSIGKFLYKLKYEEYVYEYDCDKVEYSLISTRFGIILKKYHEYSLVFRTVFKPFDMSYETDLCEFNDKKNVLSRRKHKPTK